MRQLSFALVILGMTLTAGVLSGLSGCTAPGEIFPQIEPPIVWPAEIDRPRFGYVGKIESEADLKPAVSFWEGVVNFFVGREEPARLQSAHGVVITRERVLFISDPETRAVHRFDLENRTYRALTAASDQRPFETPIGLALAGDKLLVADRSLGTITVLSPEGEPEAVLGSGILRSPVGIAVGSSGNIYVVDVTEHTIKILDRNGTLVRTFGKRGGGPGEFNYPTHIACDGEDNLYISDSLNSRVQVFDRHGNFLRMWGQRSDLPGDFSQPKGITCDRRGNVYTIDSHFENVQVFTPQGEFLLAFGKEGHGPGEFWLPIGIFIDQEDFIWVCDSFNKRVQVFRYIGEGDQSSKS